MPEYGESWANNESGKTYTIALLTHELGMVKIPSSGWLNGPWVRYVDSHDSYVRTREDFLENFTKVEP